MSPVNILPIVTVTARLFQSEAKKKCQCQEEYGHVLQTMQSHNDTKQQQERGFSEIQ